MSRVVHDIKDLLLGTGRDLDDQDRHLLWDESEGTVPGGVNWAFTTADQWDADSFLGVTGPDLDQPT